MALEKVKTEHAGAKNGGGAWTTRREAKRASRKRRRRAAKVLCVSSALALTLASGCASAPPETLSCWTEPDCRGGSDFYCDR